MWRNSRSRFGGITLERVALVVGFGLSLAGTIGSQFYFTPVADHVQTTGQKLDENWARLKIIRGANALFGLLQSFDALVHLMPADFDANPTGAGAVAEVDQRAIHDRHDAARNYFAQVASAGEVDYGDVTRRYDALVAAETADWNLTTYRATNALPAEIATKVAADRWELEKSSTRLEADFYRSSLDLRRRAWILTLLNAAGSTILFVLALLMARDRQAAPRIGGEMSRAIELMNLALLETRRRISLAKPGG